MAFMKVAKDRFSILKNGSLTGYLYLFVLFVSHLTILSNLDVPYFWDPHVVTCSKI